MDIPPLHTPGPSSPADWTFVVPVRDATRAKTRLVAPAGVDHAELVRAMATDTVNAVAEAGAAVILVTGDEVLSRIRRPGVRVIGDPAGTGSRVPADGLAAAIATGLGLVPAGRPAAVMLGDVPCLRATDVVELLTEAARQGSPAGSRAAFVRDAAGTGTTLLAGLRRDALLPRFGAGSATAHAQVAVEIGTHLPRAGRDVDTASDLAVAVGLGVGPATLRLLHSAGTDAAAAASGECADAAEAGPPLRSCLRP